MRTTHLIRLLLGIGLIICGSIVLGLSVDIEKNIRDHGRISSTSTFPYTAWVGGFTILFEILFMIARLASSDSFLGIVAVDMVWSIIMFPIWLCASALVTIRTNACDVSFGLSSSFCSKIDATAAFLWIGWALWLFVLFTLVYIIGSSQGDRHVLKEPIPKYEPKARYNPGYTSNTGPGFAPNSGFAPVTSNATGPGFAPNSGFAPASPNTGSGFAPATTDNNSPYAGQAPQAPRPMV